MRIFMIICVLSCTTPNLQCGASRNDGRMVNIGVVLDYNSWMVKVAKTAIEMAADDVNRHTSLLDGARLLLHFRDSRGDAVEGAFAALDLLEREVVAIIGPETSEVAEFILHLGEAAKVPVVSFSITNLLVSNHRFPYSLCMAHSDALQMEPIAALVKEYGWRRVTVVYPDDEFGSGVVSSLSDALRDVGSEIGYRSVISPTADEQAIREELYKLMTMQTRVFVVHVHSALASKILTEAHKIGMMDRGYVWITTEEFTGLWDVLLNSSTMASMQGLLGVKSYIQNSKELGEFKRRWKRRFRLENADEEKVELNIYGIFAYEALWTIALAIGKLGNTKFNFTKSPTFVDGKTTNLSPLKVFEEGEQLMQELIKTNIRGVHGVLQRDLRDGEIVGSAYEIVNVVGNGYKIVGFWSNEAQLSKQLPPAASTQDNNTHRLGTVIWPGHSIEVPRGWVQVTNGNGYKIVGFWSNEAQLSKQLPPAASSQDNNTHRLGTVIWPGHSIEVPRGWVQVTNGKRLKVGLRFKDVFSEFVKVTFDNTSRERKVTGFSIVVFDAALSRLNYALPYDLIPYGSWDHPLDDNPDDLVYQVYLKNFDAVVGDITITANRSRFVDFTQPYTETGLMMVVPIEANKGNNAWVFILPLTPAMWCTTGAFFVFTGFVIWLLEHRVNPEFRGKPTVQVLTLLWFSFSTLFFSQREKLVTILSRLVVIIWLFVGLILQSSYTASLTSLLTVKQMNPTVKDVESLRASGLPVGYQINSFVGNYLQEQLGIAEENLKPYLTPEEAGEALRKGPKKGGVAAIFDEIPYIRVFLASQCGYTKVGPIYRTGGLGFVFPKGSLLVSDISRAVLSLSEDNELQKIDDKWLARTDYTDSGAKVESRRLSMDSFWGLYLITGTASFIILIIFFSQMLYKFMRDPNVQGNGDGEMGDPSTGKSLKRALKSFLQYIDHDEGQVSTSALRPRVSESRSSIPAFITSPSSIGRNSLTSSMIAGRTFSAPSRLQVDPFQHMMT